MQIQNITFSLKVYSSIEELPTDDRTLIQTARDTISYAYAPYSNFKVGAVAELVDGRILIGSNQENASYGATLCAERVLLANISCLEIQSNIKTIAVSYQSHTGDDCTPVTPCGICRQVLTESEAKQRTVIRLLLSGQTGAVWEIARISDLFPLGFDTNSLQSS